MVRKIITTFIRPQLEYASVVWNPHLQKDIKKLERIQRAATRWAPELRELSYEERLKALNLTTLEARRKRGALITLYKCTTGMIDIDKEDFIKPGNRRTRGHSKKLQNKQGQKDSKKGFRKMKLSKMGEVSAQNSCWCSPIPSFSTLER